VGFATRQRGWTEQRSVVIPILYSYPFASFHCRDVPAVLARGKYPPSSQPWACRSQTPPMCPRLCRKHFHAAIPALSRSCHLQSSQSSRAAGSFVSQMARRRRRGENWRGTLCGYRETRKQEELGGGRHMSARAKPQRRSDGRRVAMRGRRVAGRKGRGVACSALLRCSAAGGTRGRKWRLSARRI
jgi:hypothetical protein